LEKLKLLPQLTQLTLSEHYYRSLNCVPSHTVVRRKV